MLNVDMLDQVEPFQEIHGAVDAGQADLGINQASAPVHLCHLEVLRGRGEDLEDCQPRSRQLQPSLVQRVAKFRGVHAGTQLRKILNLDIIVPGFRQALARLGSGFQARGGQARVKRVAPCEVSPCTDKAACGREELPIAGLSGSHP